jgi:hypothetical protein
VFVLPDRVHVLDAPHATALEQDEPDLGPLVELSPDLVGHEFGRDPAEGADASEREKIASCGGSVVRQLVPMLGAYVLWAVVL